MHGYVKRALMSAVFIGAITAGTGVVWAASGSSTSGVAGRTPLAAHAPYRKVLKAALLTVSKTLNVKPGTLLADLRSGQSIMDVANVQNVSESTLESALEAKLAGYLQKKETAGKLTSAQVTDLEAKFAAKLPTILEHKGLAHIQQAPRAKVIRKAAHVLNVKPRTLLQDIRSGQSIADVAKAQGSSENALEQTLEAKFQTAIAKRVSDGKLDAAKAGELEQKFAAWLPQILEYKASQQS
ncbi:MAG: hypothetical protein K6T83_06255 [Alicyclobacillus sp.]|nr:hypothetical protein [Alicyclobacillus sp.]